MRIAAYVYTGWHPIGERDRGSSEDLQIRLVHQRGRLQRVTLPLLAQVRACDAMERDVHRLHQLIARDRVSGV